MTDNLFSRYNRKDYIQSIYCYKDTEVYKNKLNIRDPDNLLSIENDLTYQRLSELHIEPVRGHFGVRHLLNIHKYIFQDLYYFAGKIRKEDIIKGDTRFCSCQYIMENLNNLLLELKKNNFLIGLSINDFIEKSAFLLSELNMIHPFREGNGRAIREYYRCLALKNGYIIDWSLVDSKDLLNAFIYSVTKDCSKLTDCIYRVIENK
ncbi:MAG: cell filamentation protein Fic [Clostridiaceae bacterium]|jgi:cell filamentation protein|nr:cell filamentation protein Fic [Clostridiaceae bacterium]